MGHEKKSEKAVGAPWSRAERVDPGPRADSEREARTLQLEARTFRASADAQRPRDATHLPRKRRGPGTLRSRVTRA